MILGLIIPLALSTVGVQEAETRVALATNEDLLTSIQRLADEHVELVQSLEVGVSREDRRIRALRISSGDSARPAILVVAGLDGPLAYTSDIAFDLGRRLAEQYGSDDDVSHLLDTTTIYIVPRLNPDACAARFASPLAEQRATGRGVDNDRDGRHGEDGPSDVNGDGFVSWMRVPDPDGEWSEGPTDTRVLVKADEAKGERGVWKLVPEGLDSDGDEEVAEDPELDCVVNRNFPAEWKEHAAEAGLFPTDEPEVRGLLDFVLLHADIQMVVAYGEHDNLIGKPKTVPDDAPAKDRVPARGVRESDAKLLEEIGRRYGELSKDETKGEPLAEGTFQEWCYAHRGLVTVSLALWSIPLDGPKDESADEKEEDDAPASRPTDAEQEMPEASEEPPEQPPEQKDEDKPSDDAKRLAWMDREGEAARHLGWTAFDHPALGAVEIGGFAPYALVEPPAADHARIADEQFAFLVSLGDLLARVKLVDVTAKELSEGLLEVSATLENDSLLPLFTVSGKSTRTSRPARVEIALPEGAVLLGGNHVELVSDLAGAGGRHEMRWLVEGAAVGSVGVRVETDHAGSDQAVAEAKQ